MTDHQDNFNHSNNNNKSNVDYQIKDMEIPCIKHHSLCWLTVIILLIIVQWTQRINYYYINNNNINNKMKITIKRKDFYQNALVVFVSVYNIPSIFFYKYYLLFTYFFFVMQIRINIMTERELFFFLYKALVLFIHSQFKDY